MIQEKASQIETRGLEVIVTRDCPDEFSSEWENNTLRAQWETGPETLWLDRTQLEQRRGSIVPNVMCTPCEPRSHIYGFTDTWVDDVVDELVEGTLSLQC